MWPQSCSDKVEDIGYIVDDMVGGAGFHLRPGTVTIRHTTRLYAGIAPHLDIVDSIAHHERVFG